MQCEKDSVSHWEFEDERGPQAKECRQSLNAQKGKKWILHNGTYLECDATRVAIYFCGPPPQHP